MFKKFFVCAVSSLCMFGIVANACSGTTVVKQLSHGQETDSMNQTQGSVTTSCKSNYTYKGVFAKADIYNITSKSAYSKTTATAVAVGVPGRYYTHAHSSFGTNVEQASLEVDK